MKKKLGIGLLTGLLVCGCLSWGIAPSLAHTENTTSWITTWNTTSSGTVESDLLVSGGQTVILSRMTGSQRSLTLTLQAPDGEVSGKILVENGSAVMAEVDRASLVLQQGIAQTVNLTLTASEEGTASTESDTVRVSFVPNGATEATLWADFLVPFTESASTAPSASEATVTTSEALITDYAAAYSEEMPIRLRVRGSSAYSSLVLYAADGEFPALTRYTVGSAEYLLYDGGVIDLTGVGEATVLVDVSATDLVADEETHTKLNLYARMQDEVLSQQVIPYRLSQSAWITPDSPRIVTADSPLDILIQKFDCVCTLQVSHLTAKANGTLVWEELDVGSESSSLQAVLKEDKQVTLSVNANALPPAGTYQVTMTWTWANTEVMQKTETFFVQY
jgi:hypothetical protein